MSEKSRAPSALLAIGLFKLFKAALLIALGVLALVLSKQPQPLERLSELVAKVRVDPNNHAIHHAIAAVSRLKPRQLDELGVGTFAYAALFLTEGVGLLLSRPWAEYLTVIVTMSFVPLESIELFKKPSMLKGAGILLNLLIAAFLIVRVVRRRRDERKSAR